MNSQLKVMPQGAIHEQNVEVSPIVFEECYTINTDRKFVEMVKNT